VKIFLTYFQLYRGVSGNYKIIVASIIFRSKNSLIRFAKVTLKLKEVIHLFSCRLGRINFWYSSIKGNLVDWDRVNGKAKKPWAFSETGYSVISAQFEGNMSVVLLQD